MDIGILNNIPYFLDEWNEVLEYAPDRLFISDELHPRGITRREADEYSGRVYAWLKKKGVGREDFVMVILPRGYLVPIAMLGVWKAGAAVTVVEDTYAAERIAYIRRDCGCKVVIDMDAMNEIARTEPLSGYEKTDIHDAALAVYTSGTTGNPKGVLHEYGNFKMHIALKSQKKSDPDSVIRFAFIAPLNFVAFYKNMISVLTSGHHLFIVPYATVKNPTLLRRFLEENQINATFLSPSMIRALNEEVPACVKMVYTGSEPANGVFLKGVRLVNAYAMSESFFSAAEFVMDKAYPQCPVGRPNSLVGAALLDENENEVKEGETGEICFETPFFRGYLNLPEQTEKALKNGVFHSGDLGRVMPDGYLYVLGRNNDMIKINGNRVELGEVEHVAKRVLGVDWAAARGFVKPERSFLSLYYTADIQVDPEQTREKMKEFLPYYMIPSFFIHIDSVPLLPNGKLDRKQLPEPDFNSFRSEYEAPANDLERAVVSSFEKALGMQKISVNDDFYDLGGDSLRSMQVVESAGEPLLTVPMLYEFRTPRRIAQAVAEKKALASASVEVRNEKALEHDQPLIPMQLFLMDNQLVNPESTFSNVFVMWRMPKDKVDVQRLLNAFERVIEHHPVFRSVIRIDEDFGFVQHYDPSIRPELSVERVSESELETIKQDIIAPYGSLMNKPLYRVRFFETEENVCVFLDVNHIFTDGVSMHALFRSISLAYNGEELPPDYAYLFARDTNKWTLGDEYYDAKNKMLSRYGGKQWCRCFTPDHDSLFMRSKSISHDFPVSTAKLNEFLDTHGLSLNALCVAAALCTLRDVEKKTDIMASWAYSGRDDVLYKDTVFPITKEFPVAVSFDRISSVSELIGEVNEQIRFGVACQKYPYVSETTTIESNNPFRIRTLGTMRSFDGIKGVPCETIPLVNKGAACGLMNVQILTKPDGEQRLVLSFNDAKYEDSTAERVLSVFCESIKMLMEGRLNN